MKVVEVKHFAFKGNEHCSRVWFAEGIDDFMVLIYNKKRKDFIFVPVKYTGEKENLDEIVKEVGEKVSLIENFKIAMEPALNIHNIYLGKASFHLTNYFKNDTERETYFDIVKDMNMSLKYGEDYREPRHLVEGVVNKEEDIEDFIQNLKELNICQKCFKELSK